MLQTSTCCCITTDSIELCKKFHKKILSPSQSVSANQKQFKIFEHLIEKLRNTHTQTTPDFGISALV